MRVASQGSFDHAAMYDVVAGADRYVAVGCITDATDFVGQEECTGAAWVSTDGRSWHRSVVAGAQRTRLEGVVSTPVGFIAWGSSEDGGPLPVWRSNDGATWQRSTTDLPGRVSDVIWWSGRLVAYRDLVDAEDPAAASLLTSSDGLGWSVVSASASCRALPDGRHGGLFAIGASLFTPGSTPSTTDGLWHGDVATSTDAACWSRSEPIGGSIYEVAAAGSRFVAVGSEDSQARAEGDPPPPMAAWTTIDGRTFGGSAFSPSAPRGWLGAVVSSGGRLTALGEALTSDRGYEPASWTSIDGRTWTQARSVPDATSDGWDAGDCTGGPCDLYRTKVQDLAARSGTLVAVGNTHLASGGFRAVVWIADATTATPPVQLTSSGAVTLTDDLRVRSQPRVADDSVKYEPLLPKGTLLHVLEGPIYGTGYWWYRVTPHATRGGVAVPLTLSGGASEGWVAAADRDGTPWIGVYQDVDCGPVPCSP